MFLKFFEVLLSLPMTNFWCHFILIVSSIIVSKAKLENVTIIQTLTGCHFINSVISVYPDAATLSIMTFGTTTLSIIGLMRCQRSQNKLTKQDTPLWLPSCFFSAKIVAMPYLIFIHLLKRLYYCKSDHRFFKLVC